MNTLTLGMASTQKLEVKMAQKKFTTENVAKKDQELELTDKQIISLETGKAKLC